jgi:branched-chain amino acid transport system substrate-binding protein
MGRTGRHVGLWTAGAAVLALAAAGCGSSGSSSGSGPITIGVSVSLSGDFSGDGLATKQGYETWAAYQNAHGGILGRQIKIDFLSDGSSPTQVVTNYQKLITVDHVDFVLGPYSTLLTKPSSVIANRYSKVMLEGIGGGPSVFQQGLHNVFDVSASAKYQLITFAKWLASAHKPEDVAYATMTDPFLQPMLDGARSYLTSKGFTSVYYTVYPVETTDFTPLASAIAATKAPVVVLGSMPPDGYAFIQDFIQDHYSPQILIEASGPDQGAAFVKAVGATNTGGIMVPNTWYPGETFYQNSAMVAEYLKLFGTTSGINNDPNNISADVAEAFSAGQVLTQAVDHVGSTDNSKLESYLRSGAMFNSAQGPVKFLADGENGAATPFVFQWQKGVLQDVLPLGVGKTVPLLDPKPAWGANG